MSNLTILIPALNEEDSIEITVRSLYITAKQYLDAVEIIVVDDGSTDRTGQIVDALASAVPMVTAIHHTHSMGLGYIFREGIARAQYENITFIPGDNAYNASSMHDFLSSAGHADMILGYRTNQFQARRLHRAIISILYTWVMKILFLAPIRDFHGPVIYPVQKMRALRLTSTVSQVEWIIKLLRMHCIYVQKPVQLNDDKSRKSRALRWKTFVSIAAMVQSLWFSKEDLG
jgi:glycosyltransferase involved in cell wall biosynthesis